MTIKTYKIDITDKTSIDIDRIFERFENKEIINISIVPNTKISSFRGNLSGNTEIDLYIVYRIPTEADKYTQESRYLTRP